MASETIRDRWGYMRRPRDSERDRTDELVFAAKQAIAAVPARRVTAEVLEWALDGDAARARRAKLVRKPFTRRRRPAEDVEPRKQSEADKLVEAARSALTALPRQALRDAVVEWALELGLGK